MKKKKQLFKKHTCERIFMVHILKQVGKLNQRIIFALQPCWECVINKIYFCCVLAADLSSCEPLASCFNPRRLIPKSPLAYSMASIFRISIVCSTLLFTDEYKLTQFTFLWWCNQNFSFGQKNKWILCVFNINVLSEEVSILQWQKVQSLLPLKPYNY